MATYYMGGRRSGKTLRLIVLSEATRTPIIVSNKKRAECLIDQAKRMGFDIPEPLTLQDYMSSNKFIGRRDIRENGLYIDNVDDVVKELFKDIPIKAVTFDEPDNFIDITNDPGMADESYYPKITYTHSIDWDDQIRKFITETLKRRAYRND